MNKCGHVSNQSGTVSSDAWTVSLCLSSRSKWSTCGDGLGGDSNNEKPRGRRGKVIDTRVYVGFDARGMQDALTYRYRAADIIDGVEVFRVQRLAACFGVEMRTEASGGKGFETGRTLFGTRRAGWRRGGDDWEDGGGRSEDRDDGMAAAAAARRHGNEYTSASATTQSNNHWNQGTVASLAWAPGLVWTYTVCHKGVTPVRTRQKPVA